ncbi:ExeM/NucH family extracellular endonuclease [Nocardioides albidus]|uniref:ExeM/NucH family extracellular endonuclease n=1 Tax=Nocardioides albidus TaxID=1517589 RepID=A0A5C4VUD6_9ACTN|nr:ExeM/NucH family extracellular endonuclease [Nocardioides albidus]TNM39437.1 ExeM/NucH family extracellular endonuclease [Nocardioides albidus]
MRSAKQFLLGSLGAALAASGLTALGAGPAHAVSGVFLSEFHYDDSTTNDAGGVGEFVEVTAPAGTSLDGWQVVLVNGATGAAYRTDTLSGSVADQSGGWGTKVVGYPVVSGGILQNGAPDGIALLNAGGAVVEFVSYEGAMTATLGTSPAPVDATETGAGVESNTTPGTDSVQRKVDGGWAAPAAHSRGLPNGYAGSTDPGGPGGPGGPGDPGTPVAIADIQGSGASSPLATTAVTTEGVVTAAYPTGGFNGFYIQTPGADTPERSDAVFVFGGVPAGIVVGDSVRVSGTVKEFGSLTEIDVTGGQVTEIASLGTVVPKPVLPGTDCALPGTGCLGAAELESAREAAEGELFAPTGAYTVTDVYDGSAYNPPSSGSSSHFGEIGLAANSDEPLITPTDIIDAQDTAAIVARTRWNNAHRVILDDGSTTTYWNTSNTAAGKDLPLPWLTRDHHVRVGAGVTFDQPVVLDYRFGWKVQPTSQVVGAPTGKVTFEQNRPAAPAAVGGDLKLATFNVLNYFTTLGVDYGGCTAYVDRAGDPVAVNQCPGSGPRGAWDATNFERQQAKIVSAIDTIDADIVSVEEIENSLVVDNADRDEALGALVTALNADAGAGTWDYVRSPADASSDTNKALQDVIRTGFIYKPAAVTVVGDAEMRFGTTAFDNAREPFAAVFQPVGGAERDRFAVIVNHFKSKGSGVNDGTGQGNANPDRIAQATELADFAGDFAAARGVGAVFLTGDFNSYSQEDPMQVLAAAGYEQLVAEGKHSYSFDGQSGSLDHVLANPAAAEMVSGVDIWETNANETVFNQYSRYNYVGTDLYESSPFGASDHNPEVIGIDRPAPTAVVNTEAPTVWGTARVGRQLVADAGTWTPSPSAVSFQWYADGVPIAGATDARLRLTGRLAGAVITVAVTARAPDLEDATAVSAPVGPVTRGAGGHS